MPEQRKVVTILFADVVGSTAMAEQSDPEVVRATMARYFQRIAEISQSYGGTVEKFAGDAAMVVFGVPVVHDDDAERAVRAALEIRDGASELEVRVGVNTGEAVTAAREDRQFMVSGDSVNVAARLQQGAEPGEVVVGPLTEQLTRKVIEYAPHEPVAARGKATPLIAFRAVQARTLVPEQARGVPGLHSVLVGRDRELRLLLDIFARTVERAVEASRMAGDIQGEIGSRFLGSFVAFSLGHLAEFVEINERLIEQARAIGDTAQEAAITARLVAAERMRGNAAMSDRRAKEAEDLAVAHGFRDVILRLEFDRAAKHLFDGDLATAEAATRRYGFDAAEAGAVQHQISALRFLGYTLLYAGRFAESARAVDQALELSQASGERWNRSELLGLRARAALELADLATADRLIDRAVATLRDGDITAVAEVHSHLGMIRAAQGRDAEAETALRHGLQIVDDTEYHLPRAEAALDLARFLAQRERFDEARALCNQFGELSQRLGLKRLATAFAETRRAISERQTT